MDSGAGHVGPERRTGLGRDSRDHGDGLQKNAFRTLRAVQAGVRQTADRGLQPVSYTHLDVYKRQIAGTAATPERRNS